MGLLDSVKDLYYQAEEKYYKVLDRIEEAIPIYKVIDPLDSVIPSFALLILIAALGLILGVGAIGSAFLLPTTTTLTVTVFDSDNTAIQGANVKFVVLGEEVKNQNTGDDGTAFLEDLKEGEEVLVEVNKSGFLTKVDTAIITEAGQQLLSFTLEEESLAVLTKTIRIVDSLGASLAKEFTLSFLCSSPYASAPPNAVLTPSDNGVATVTVPTNCEKLIVSVTDNTIFSNVTSFEIFPQESDVKIQLQEIPQEKGTLTVVLRSNGGLVQEAIEVDLFRYEELLENPEIGPIDTEFSSGGRAEFRVAPGNYLAKTVSTSSYGEVRSPKILLSAGENEDVTLELVQNIVGEIKIKVVDTGSNEPIDDAKVTLKQQSDDTIIDTQKTDKDSESIVVFNISKDITYRAVVEADGYQLGKRESLNKSDAIYRIELDPCTPSTCGELRIKVIDQDGAPVNNAAVALYNADTGFLAGFSNKTSDANGEAEFDMVESGNYFAFAFKESVSGRSDEVFFSASAQPTSEFHLTVTMLVPAGVIKAIISDKDQKPIAFPIVSVFDDRTDELLGNSIADANGEFTFETKADKKVYLKVRQKDTQPEFADYTTIAKPILPGSVQTFNVTLEPEIIDKNVEIEFLGLFSSNGQTATVLSKGKEYTAKFKLRLPEEKNYSQSGVHIRTGKELIMEKDPLFIKSVSAPNTSQIKATSFDEASGATNFDLSNSDAKWVNVVWTNPQAGIYEIEAIVKVKETASIKDELKIFWRAWAENGSRERNPKDESITQEIYSETFSRIYEIGVATLCDNNFCFSARIRDINENLIESVVDSYNARMLSEYELKFTILNNSDFRVHDNANLRIKNEDETILFTDFELLDAQTRKTTGTLNDFEFDRFDVGTLKAKNNIDFTTKFFTQKPQTGVINIKLVSDEQIVFEKNLAIEVGATKNFDLKISPSIFPSGIENDINVLVVDSATKLEVEGATVKLKDKHGNVLFTGNTRKDGFAFLTLPAQLPGTKLLIEVEKAEYKTAAAELKIKGDIIDISPDQLGLALNTKTKHSAEAIFNVTNTSTFPLKVSRIDFAGDFKNLIDKQATQAGLDVSFKDFVIEENKTEEFKVKVFLTDEGKSLSQREDIDASIEMEFSNFGKNWGFSIPVKIAIDLEGAVDDPSCLILNRTSWQTTTEGDPVKMEFQLENNCTIEGQPIELKKLQAQVVLESNNLGIFDITIGENKTELRSGYNKTLLTRLKPEQTIVGILSFTPFGGVNGEQAATIKIAASNSGETEEQVLEQEIAAKLMIVNLVQCISIDPVLIEMTGQKDSGASTSFNINAGTGSVSCGGPVDFELESDIEVSPKNGRIEDGATQKIEVLRGDAIQGQYPVFVKTKFGSEQKEQLLGTVRVRILEEGCIQLSRFEYDLYDSPEDEFDGFDTGTVSNKCFDKPVPIRVNLRSFMDAMKFGSTIGIVTFGVSILGQGLGGLFGADTTAASVTNSKIDALEKNLKTEKAKVEALQKERNELKNKPNKSAADQDRISELETELKKSYENTQTLSDLQAELQRTISLNENKIQELEQQKADGSQVSQEDLDNLKQELKEQRVQNQRLKSFEEEYYKQYPEPAKTATAEPPVTLEVGTGPYKFEQISRVLPYADILNVRNVKDNTNLGRNIVRYDTARGAFYFKLTGDPANPDYYPINYAVEANPAAQENPFAVSTGTGLAALFEPARTPTGLQVRRGNRGGGFFGGGRGLFGGGGIFGMGGSLINGILGQSDPATQGLQAFLLASIADYFLQEKDARFVTIQRDVEIMGVEIKKPGEEQARSNVFNKFLSSRTVSNIVGKNIPEQLKQFLPFFSGESSFLNIFTGGDEDVEVEQELRTTMKALPTESLSPELISSFFGSRSDSTLPALALSASPNASNQKIEKRSIIFKNKSGFTTTKDQPLYKILRVIAIRHGYKDKEYNRDDFDVENKRSFFNFDMKDPIIDPTSAKLDELPPVPVDELFHLEFNAVPPETQGNPIKPLLNCQDGFRVGSTGARALPKVKFDWSWSEIAENECNVDNENGVYCDATQFSISLLKKINSIAEWVKTNGPGLTCPSPLDAYASTAIISDFDIGISSAAVSKGGNNADVTFTVQNKNPGKIDAVVAVELRDAGTGLIVSGQSCANQNVSVISEEKAKCSYTGLAVGNYIAQATITPTVDCENCLDEPASNTLNINFTVGPTGLEECKPFSTARLEQFVAVSGVDAQEILSKISFQANLIEDRYSSDLQNDFDLYAKTQSFFDAPDYYTAPDTGLGIYFKDKELFGFSSKFDEPKAEGYRLPGPGIYNVEIDIVYDDSSWTLFDNEGPNAKIIVSFEKADTPEPDSPFYKLPFNGTIGENGRVNYGLNYRGDSIYINSKAPGLVSTIEIPGSSPVAELTVEKIESFKEMNTDERGLVLRVTSGLNPTISFAPSFATPVILKMSNKFDEAYAFYSVEVDGGAANTGSFLTRWNGVGFNCKAFDDRFASEFFFTADTHGLNEFRECARVPGEMEQTSYGFEFCSPKKFGNMYLKTAFYTPQDSQSFLKINTAQEEAAFITPSANGTIVALDNTVTGTEINSIEDIFDLVKSEFVCMSSEESKTEFWWNPKKVFEGLDDKEADLINSCILD